MFSISSASESTFQTELPDFPGLTSIRLKSEINPSLSTRARAQQTPCTRSSMSTQRVVLMSYLWTRRDSSATHAHLSVHARHFPCVCARRVPPAAVGHIQTVSGPKAGKHGGSSLPSRSVACLRVCLRGLSSSSSSSSSPRGLSLPLSLPLTRSWIK
ncbi:hypothetical protein XENOCAPTIV_022176 [Xenoophorus captivus]|uniref:Uncharacterized protein n=1 Tax=Xenoophorus captivus TaxID=1517983 RepID=A0ABV0RNP8_9TELE